jgi:hypothetical protein
MVPARGRLGACDLGGRRDGCPGDRSVRRAVPGRGRRRSPSDADGRVIHWHPDPVLVEEMFVQIARSVTGDHTTLILQDVAAPAGPVPSRPAAPPPTRRCDRDDRSPRWCRRPADRAARTGRAVSIISPTRRLRHTRSRAPSGSRAADRRRHAPAAPRTSSPARPADSPRRRPVRVRRPSRSPRQAGRHGDKRHRSPSFQTWGSSPPAVSPPWSPPPPRLSTDSGLSTNG